MKAKDCQEDNQVMGIDKKKANLIGKHSYLGQKGEDFKAVRTDLSVFNLYQAQYDGKYKVISITPSIDTGVCELQTIRINQEAKKYDEGLVFLSISCDLPFAQQRFMASKGIDSVEFISDHHYLDFGLKYGFVIKEYRLLNRGFLILDDKNIIRYVEYVKDNSQHIDYEKAFYKLRKIYGEPGD